MATKLHSLILALVAGGMAATGWAQNAPNAGPPGAGEAPSAHGWHGHDGPPPAWGGRGDGDDDGEHDWHGHWHGHGRFGGPGEEFHGLDLTEDQHRRIQIIVLNARLQALQARKPSGKDDLAALLNPGDPNYTVAVQEAKKRAAEHIQRMSDLRQQIYNVLTPEQKAEFAKRMADRKARMAARGEHEGPKGPPAPAAR